MDDKFTPGPWHVGTLPGWSGICILRRPANEYGSSGVVGDAPIAQIISGAAHWENKYPVGANALLIAAAPELLDNLILAEDWLSEMKIEDDPVNRTALISCLADIRAAIAKATGANP